METARSRRFTVWFVGAGDRRCPRCHSEMVLLFRFYHCGAKCEDLDSSALAALRRRNAGVSEIDDAWEVIELWKP